MSTPFQSPGPDERNRNQQPGSAPLNPGGSGPAPNADSGSSPGPHKPAAPYSYQAAQPAGYAYPTSARMPEAVRPPMPREVNWAFWLIIAAGVLNFVSTLLGSGSGPTTGSFGALGMGIAVFFALLFTGIYVLLAVFIRKGHNWARITATVLAALSVILMVTGWLALSAVQNNPNLPPELAGESLQPDGLTLTLGILTTLLGVAGVVLCWLKQSNPYFRPQQMAY